MCLRRGYQSPAPEFDKFRFGMAATIARIIRFCPGLPLAEPQKRVRVFGINRVRNARCADSLHAAQTVAVSFVETCRGSVNYNLVSLRPERHSVEN